MAKFILSLDCEGKWGVADHLGSFHHSTLSDQNLRRSYRAILDLLEEFEIPATFAFVGCFSMSAQMLAQARPELEELALSCPDYLVPAIQDIWQGTGSGWTGDWAYDAVLTSTLAHEIALHGATHVPWDTQKVDVALARRELGILARVGAAIASEAKTYIFPRNVVAHTSVLREFGIIGYREARPFHGRVRSLLSELNLFAQPDGDAPLDAGGVRIPPGYFINWRHGPRRLVPADWSALRAGLMLERAVEGAGTVHYWMHPENVASAPDTLSLLRKVVRQVAKSRDAGLLEVVTQDQYCRQILAELATPA